MRQGVHRRDWKTYADRIQEHDRDIRFARTETSAVSEHAHNTGHKPLWNEVKFIDRDPYHYMRRVKEAIHIRLHPNNLVDSGIEILEAWKPTIKKKTQQQESRAVPCIIDSDNDTLQAILNQIQVFITTNVTGFCSVVVITSAGSSPARNILLEKL